MYIFSRARTIDPGRGADAMRMATEASAKVSELTGLSWTAWYQSFHPDGPAILSTARLEHLEDLDRAFLLMTDSADYQDLAAEWEEYTVGPAVDAIFEPVAGDPPQQTPFVTVVQATAANGHLRAAMHWGADLAERFSRSMSIPTVFGRSLYGTYGTLLWGSYFEDINAMEGAQAKMAADEMMQAVADEGAHNVQPGATAVVLRKLT